MIKKFISRVFGRGDKPAVHDSKPVIYGPDKHHVRKDHISRGARKTCEDLQRAGAMLQQLQGALAAKIVGQRTLQQSLMIGLLASGHVAPAVNRRP